MIDCNAIKIFKGFRAIYLHLFINSSYFSSFNIVNLKKLSACTCPETSEPFKPKLLINISLIFSLGLALFII